MLAVSENIETCPDSHQCENGGICVEPPSAEGKYYCDCDESNLGGAKVFSGLYCQHEATVYYTMTGELSRTSFCTNNGICRGTVTDKQEHLGCDCPEGYTGKVGTTVLKLRLSAATSHLTNKVILL